MALEAEAGQVPAEETEPLIGWLEHRWEDMIAENAERRLLSFVIASAALDEGGWGE